jgi:hypothetical protein
MLSVVYYFYLLIVLFVGSITYISLLLTSRLTFHSSLRSSRGLSYSLQPSCVRLFPFLFLSLPIPPGPLSPSLLSALYSSTSFFVYCCQ